MPFPSNDVANATFAADRLVGLAKYVRSEAEKYIAQCDAAQVRLHDLINVFCVNGLVPASAEWAILRAVSGVPAAVRAKFPGAFASDAAVTTALTDAQTQIDDTITYCEANVPKDASGYVLTLKVVGHAFEQRVLSAPAGTIAALRARLVPLRDAFSP